MEENSDVQLIIKAPNQNIDDQIIYCNLEWSIIQLKVHLAEVYPSKPGVQEQKLIYSGRLLRDHLQLKDILRHQEDKKTSSVHTLHLVCSRQNKPLSVPSNKTSQNVPQGSCSESNDDTQSSDSTDSGDSPSRRQRDYQNHTSDDSSGGTSSQSTPLPSFALNADDSGQMSYMQQLYANYFSQQTQNFGTSAWSSAQFPQVSSSDIANQMAAYQQMYANYYAQCMQSLQSSSGSNAVPVGGFPQNATPVVENQNDVPVPPAPAAAPNRNVRMNAQGGPVLDDNENAGNRDWLDYFYLWCRGFVLFSIVYFYSSPERLLLVVGLALMAFLYQEGWLLARVRNNRHVENRRNNTRQRPAPHDHQNNTEDAPPPNQNAIYNDRERQPGNEIEAIMDADDPPHVENPDVTNNQNPAWTFITSFFSSLIPEPPPPVNIN